MFSPTPAILILTDVSPKPSLKLAAVVGLKQSNSSIEFLNEWNRVEVLPDLFLSF